MGGLAGEAGNAGEAGGKGDSVDLSGSYVVHAGASADGRESNLAPIRVDLRRDTQGRYEAAVGVRGYPIAPFAVVASPTGVALTGDALAQETPPNSEVISYARLSSLSLPRAASGTIGGRGGVTTLSRLVTDGGDNSDHVEKEATFSAEIVRDTTPPVWSLPERYRKGPPGVIFPWETVRVALSEGAPGADLLGLLALSVDDAGGPLPVSGAGWVLEPNPDPSVAWAGALGAMTWFPDWDMIAGKALLIEAHAIADLEGNVSTALTRQQPVAAIGRGESPLSFDAPNDALFTWGEARLEAPGEAGERNPACEAGGCLALGPFVSPLCHLPVAGVAGRLQVPAGASKLVVRYRVAIAGVEPLSRSGASFQVRVTRPGSPSASVVERQLTAADQLAPRPDSETLSTPWLTLEVPLAWESAVGGAEIGFSIDAGVDTLRPDCIFSYPEPPFELYLDSVQIE